MLHLMNREISTDDEDLTVAGKNWTRINNDRLPEMFVLGRAKQKPLPLEFHRGTKFVIQTTTNFRERGIILPEKAHFFRRLYLHNTVFHSDEVC